MNFKDLERFISTDMRMSHVYQPAMLKVLLINGGEAEVNQIAKHLLSLDQPQIEYYEHRTKTMVGDVLTNKRQITIRDKNVYRLPDFDSFSEHEVRQLIELCDKKIDEYINVRGEEIWSHRKNASAYISGSTQYEVLKRASRKCELCGMSANDKRLEVDHIVPRSKGGSNDISNLQALCYTCNQQKGNRDDTDYREVLRDYGVREDNCLFCTIHPTRIIDENELAYVIKDAFPVTEEHRLIIPKRHVAEYFDLYQPELNAVNQLLTKHKALIEAEDSTVSGFNRHKLWRGCRANNLPLPYTSDT